MKLYLLLIIFLFSVNVADAQLPDTILTTNGKTTYVVFPSEVSYVNISHKAYVAKPEGKILLIKSLSADAPATNFMVQYGDVYHTGMISFQQGLNDADVFYKVGEHVSAPEEQITVATEKEEQVTKVTEQETVVASAEPAPVMNSVEEAEKEAEKIENLRKISMGIRKTMEKKDKIHDLGIVYDRQLILFIKNIFIDESGLYFKLVFNNKSAADFDIDYVGFRFNRSHADKAFRGSDTGIIEFTPLVTEGKTSIAAKSEEAIYFGVPSFGIGRRDTLEIVIREKDGARTIEIPIDPARIMKATILE